jgi:hypothetical protein
MSTSRTATGIQDCDDLAAKVNQQYLYWGAPSGTFSGRSDLAMAMRLGAVPSASP